MSGRLLSYSAGSMSLDPHKFRVIDPNAPPTKLQQLLACFEEVRPFFEDPEQVLVIDNYPASLGGFSILDRVVTYLHSPTCTRALKLAQIEQRKTIFIAQPLAGAQLLLDAIDREIELPREMLWATGGYPFASSLQTVLKQQLAEQGCDLMVMHAYGVAELDHTLMAAIHRDANGELIYHRIDEAFQVHSANELTFRDESIPNSDQIEPAGDTFRILGNPDLYPREIQCWLNSWHATDWQRYTGYLRIVGGTAFMQERSVTNDSSRRLDFRRAQLEQASRTIPNRLKLVSVEHHEFQRRFGMNWLEKPLVDERLVKQRPARVLSTHRMSAA